MPKRNQNYRPTGLNPLAYLGTRAPTPTQLIIVQRDPTINDNTYNLGTLWVERNPQKIFILATKSGGSALWVQLYPGGSSTGASVFPANIGSATQSGGELNLLGSNVITTSGSGNTVTVSMTNGANGQLIIGGGSAPAWSSVTAGTGIALTTGANSLTIATTGSSAATSFTTDGGTAVPVGGVLNILGGEMLNTAGASDAITINFDRGTNGQIPIAATGAATAFANITSSNGTMTITNGANSLDLSAIGSGGNSGTVVNKKRVTSFAKSNTSAGIAATTTPTTVNTALLTSLTLTPASSSNILSFEFYGPYFDEKRGAIFCLFEGTTLLATSDFNRGSGSLYYYNQFLFTKTAGTTSATTYSIRYAGSTGGGGSTTYMNSGAASSSILGDSLAWTFTITEEIP